MHVQKKILKLLCGGEIQDVYYEKEIEISTLNITNYFSFLLIKSKKYNALSVRLTARILHIKQQQNTIIKSFFIYTVFM